MTAVHAKHRTNLRPYLGNIFIFLKKELDKKVSNFLLSACTACTWCLKGWNEFALDKHSDRDVVHVALYEVPKKGNIGISHDENTCRITLHCAILYNIMVEIEHLQEAEQKTGSNSALSRRAHRQNPYLAFILLLFFKTIFSPPG